MAEGGITNCPSKQLLHHFLIFIILPKVLSGGYLSHMAGGVHAKLINEWQWMAIDEKSFEFGKWHHIALTWDQHNGLALYKNGKL